MPLVLGKITSHQIPSSSVALFSPPYIITEVTTIFGLLCIYSSFVEKWNSMPHFLSHCSHSDTTSHQSWKLNWCWSGDKTTADDAQETGRVFSADWIDRICAGIHPGTYCLAPDTLALLHIDCKRGQEARQQAVMQYFWRDNSSNLGYGGVNRSVHQ